MEEERDWDLIKSLYAVGCNENEFQVFKHLIERYNLDPISKEIWCIKTEKQAARIFVSRDGHLAIAQRGGNFGGMNTTIDFGPNPEIVDVTDKYGKKLGRVAIPFSATTTINRKDSPYPTIHTVYWDEYGSKSSLWASKPKTMLQKVAECQCLRRAFDMHGFYASEEINDDLPSLDAKVIEEEESKLDRNGALFVSRKNRVPTELPADDYVPSDMKNIKITGVQIEDEKKEEVKKEEVKKEEVKKEEKQQTIGEKIDAVVDASFEVYGESDFETAKTLFTNYCLNMDVLEKAKIGDGKWNKTMIIDDFKKQMAKKSGGN